MRRRTVRVAAAVMALTLIGAACTGDDDTTEGTDGAEPTSPDGAEPTSPDEPQTTEPQGGDGTVDQVQQGESILRQVRQRDSLRCGTRDELPGFAVLRQGEHVGFDADFCRVIAAAVLGDAEKVEFVDVETDDRFVALQSGQIDVLVRNTTWTAQRDGAEGATFLTTTFYDGQGMMVKADSQYQSLDDMDNVIVCVAQGTTTEGNAASEASARGLQWEVRSFANPEQIQQAFQQDQCDGWSSDVSQLSGFRSEYPDGPESVRILDEVFSKEPLGPAVNDGDSEWAQVVDWAVIATIQAEEFGITSQNIDSPEFQNTDDPNIQRFLGLQVVEDGEEQGVLDPGLGLPPDYAYAVVKQVGNYAEIYEEHITPLGVERGLNSLWNDPENPGLLYAPPYR